MQDTSLVLCNNNTSYGDLQAYYLSLFDSSFGDAPYSEPLSLCQSHEDDSFYLTYDDAGEDYPTDLDSSNGPWLEDVQSYFAGFCKENRVSSNKGYYTGNQWANYLGFDYGGDNKEYCSDQENQDYHQDVAFNTIGSNFEDLYESIFGHFLS